MNQPDDLRRTGTAWIITLAIHIIVLLIPVTMKMASEASTGPEIKGYISGLVDLSGSPDGAPGIGAPGSGHEGGSSTAITVDKPKPKPETTKLSAKPETKKPDETAAAKIPDPKSQQPAKEPVRTTEELKRDPIKDTSNSESKDVKDGKSGTEASAGDKNGAGSGSGTGTGSGTGSGSGSGEGSGNGSGTGNGNEQGPGSGPKRHGLGTGQGSVLIGFKPVYPKSAQNDGTTGKVFLRITINTNGSPGVTILQSSGDKRLDEAAKRAAKICKYKPEEAAYHIDVAFEFSGKGIRMEYLGAGWEEEKP